MIIPSRGFGLTFCILLTLLSCAFALQANLAGIVDWHKPLIGPPLLEPTPPRLIDGKVLAITRKNVLAVLDAESGAVAWRYLLDERDPVVSYHVHGNSVLLLSGPSATTARLFSLSSGHVIWETQLLPNTDAAHLVVPVYLGTDAGFTEESEPSVVVLSDARRVTKLGIADARVLWSIEAPGAGSTILFKQLFISGQRIHILALTSSFASNTLTTITLDLATSAPIADLTQIPSAVTSPSDGILAASSVTDAARILWLEAGRIRSADLSSQGALGKAKDLLPGKGRKYVKILNDQMREMGYVLGEATDGSVDIIDVREGGKILDSFEGSANTQDKSPSVYSASTTTQGELPGKKGVIFNRMYWSFSLNLAVAQTYRIDSAGTVIASGFTFPFDTASHGVMMSAAVSNSISSAQLPSLILSTSNGALLFAQQERQKETIRWTREESLAEIAAVRFIDLGEPAVEEVRHVLADESFFGRVARHLAELRDLPNYLYRFISRLITASYTSAVAATPLSADRLHRDQFGFQKLLVAVTKGGKLFAMDSANGNIVWSKNLGLSSENGTDLDVKGMWIVRDLGELGNPILAVLATRSKESSTSAVGFRVDAFTGEIFGGKDEQTDLATGKELFSGRSEIAFLLPFENCGTKDRVLAVVDSTEKQLHIFPSCKKVAAGIANISQDLSFTLTERSLSGPVIRGYTPSSFAGTFSFDTTEMWSMSFGHGETILSVEPVGTGQVASYGRALGDKSTLYKYLNPHLTVITTTTPASNLGHVYVVDTTTGDRVYEVEIAEVRTDKGVKAAMVENWLVYAWLDGNGWKLGSVELFEKRSSDLPGSNVSNAARVNGVNAISHTFILPTDVKVLSFTDSKFAITAKDLIFVNGQNQIGTINRRLVDPRRPIGSPTSSDKEEMLIPYDPIIAIDPKRFVSHNYQVLGIDTLTTSPALLESTSLLFAHGLDLFLTRGLAPSGTFDILSDSFNKVQLLLTLAVLSGGIAVAKPAVRQKALKAKWF